MLCFHLSCKLAELCSLPCTISHDPVADLAMCLYVVMCSKNGLCVVVVVGDLHVHTFVHLP